MNGASPPLEIFVLDISGSRVVNPKTWTIGASLDYIDPANLDGMVDVIFTYKDAYDAFAHELFNTEVTVGDLEFDRILKYWERALVRRS
jgi:hypothetical protein